ncbi:MAG: hypothetical protein NWF06_00750 [Candidatus Bathyarchaeota archaeon]|nr:hypothetical protein [Candidatus Bathyarchaeum sp.]
MRLEGATLNVFFKEKLTVKVTDGKKTLRTIVLSSNGRVEYLDGDTRGRKKELVAPIKQNNGGKKRVR